MSKEKKIQDKAWLRLSEKTMAAMDLIREAEKIASDHGLVFSFDIAYGMGGTFVPKSSKADYEPDRDDSYGWQPSSHSC